MPNIETITTKGVVYNVVDTGARNTINNLSEVARTGSFNNLADLPTVNGQVLKGDIVITTDVPTYESGTGINIAGSVISVNFSEVAAAAHKHVVSDITDLIKYTAGTGINISASGVISATGGSSPTYQAGDGININGDTISVDFTDFAPVASTGSYNDLTDLPVVNGSELKGSHNFATLVNGKVPTDQLPVLGGATYTEGYGIAISDTNEISIKFSSERGISVYESGIALDFATVASQSDLDSISERIPTKTSQLTNDKNYVDEDYVTNAIANISGDSDSTDIVVSGAGNTSTNGTYKLMDSSATGTSRVWKHESATLYIYWSVDYNRWFINMQNGAEGVPWYSSSTACDNPWDDTAWQNGDAPVPAPTVTLANSGSESVTYTEGEGISITDNTISVDFNVAAKKEYVDGLIGNISTVLDEINGEEV